VSSRPGRRSRRSRSCDRGRCAAFVQFPGGAAPCPCGSPASVRWISQRPRCGLQPAWVAHARTRSEITRRSEVRSGVRSRPSDQDGPASRRRQADQAATLPRPALRSIRMRAPHVRSASWPSRLLRASCASPAVPSGLSDLPRCGSRRRTRRSVAGRPTRYCDAPCQERRAASEEGDATPTVASLASGSAPLR
jgi:hypothetical protein